MSVPADFPYPLGQVVEIPIDQILVNPKQPRRSLKKETIQELSASMKAKGQLVPASVRPLTEEERAANPGNWVMHIGGHRRRAAAILNQSKTLKCIVEDIPPKETHYRAVMDNDQEEMDWWDWDLAIEEDFRIHPELTHEQLAARLSKGLTKVRGALKITSAMNSKARAMVDENLQKTLKNEHRLPMLKNKGFLITERILLALADLGDPIQVERALRVVMDEYLTESETKKLVKWVKDGNKPETYGSKKPPGGGSDGGPGSGPSDEGGSGGGGNGGSGGSSGGGGSTPSIGTPENTDKTTETPTQPVVKKQGAGASILSWFARVGQAIDKRVPKWVMAALKLLGRFLALPHHPCKYVANKLVPIGGSSSYSSGSSHRGVSLVLLARHWAIYLLLLPFSYVITLALIGHFVGDLLPSTRSWFDNLTGSLFHLLVVQIPLGFIAQALRDPVWALVLGGFILWVIYEVFSPKREVMAFFAVLLIAAWLLRGYWGKYLPEAANPFSSQRHEEAKESLVTAPPTTSTAQVPTPQVTKKPSGSARKVFRSTVSVVAAPKPAPTQAADQNPGSTLSPADQARIQAFQMFVKNFADTLFGPSYHDIPTWLGNLKAEIVEGYQAQFFYENYPPAKIQEIQDKKWVAFFKPTQPPQWLGLEGTTDVFLVEGVVTTKSDLNYPGEVVSTQPIDLKVWVHQLTQDPQVTRVERVSAP